MRQGAAGTLEPMLNMADGLARLGALAENPVVRTLAEAFDEAGFELAVVGGPVRDALLGRAVTESISPALKQPIVVENRVGADGVIGMEACATAHHWARELTQLGHTVRLIPPQYVKIP